MLLTTQTLALNQTPGNPDEAWAREEGSSFQHILLVHVPGTVCHNITVLVFISSSVQVPTKYSQGP